MRAWWVADSVFLTSWQRKRRKKWSKLFHWMFKEHHQMKTCNLGILLNTILQQYLTTRHHVSAYECQPWPNKISIFFLKFLGLIGFVYTQVHFVRIGNYSVLCNLPKKNSLPCSTGTERIITVRAKIRVHNSSICHNKIRAKIQFALLTPLFC